MLKIMISLSCIFNLIFSIGFFTLAVKHTQVSSMLRKKNSPLDPVANLTVLCDQRPQKSNTLEISKR